MNILDKIVAQKREEIGRLPVRPANAENLAWALKAGGQRRDFACELRYPRNGRMGLIAEIKKASPSAGLICADFDAARLAREYAEAGASCLSVLTDEQFFQGSLKYLAQAREAVDLPLLRKDFIIHERQIIESVEWGADAILLIVAILTNAQLFSYLQLAKSAGLAVLTEVHDENELERAVEAGAEIIGVNNRDLKTFKVDLATTERLAPKLQGAKPAVAGNGMLGHERLLVAESGIHTAEDVQRLKACGAHAILVGESLMREQDKNKKIAELLRLV